MTSSVDMAHMDYLHEPARWDVRELERKEATYRGSWKKRGGVGAFMMCARKWDRLEEIVRTHSFDIFGAIEREPSGSDGTALAEVRDLRRYLLLIEAEMLARGIVGNSQEPNRPGTPDDGGHHARHIERLEDGATPPHLGLGNYIRMTSGHYLVDRDKLEPSAWEHLPRLSTELNNKEWMETQPEYQGLYKWSEAASKWVMEERYRRSWARDEAA